MKKIPLEEENLEERSWYLEYVSERAKVVISIPTIVSAPRT